MIYWYNSIFKLLYIKKENIGTNLPLQSLREYRRKGAKDTTLIQFLHFSTPSGWTGGSGICRVSSQPHHLLNSGLWLWGAVFYRGQADQVQTWHWNGGLGSTGDSFSGHETIARDAAVGWRGLPGELLKPEANELIFYFIVIYQDKIELLSYS